MTDAINLPKDFSNQKKIYVGIPFTYSHGNANYLSYVDLQRNISNSTGHSGPVVEPWESKEPGRQGQGLVGLTVNPSTHSFTLGGLIQ